jgi:hypothetical protein
MQNETNATIRKMNNDFFQSSMTRFFAGMFAGVVFGSFVEMFLFWDGPSRNGIRLPIIGAAVGGLFLYLLILRVEANCHLGFASRQSVCCLG